MINKHTLIARTAVPLVSAALFIGAPAHAIPFCVSAAGYTNGPCDNNITQLPNTVVTSPYGDFDARLGFLQYSFTGAQTVGIAASGTGIAPAIAPAAPFITVTQPPFVPDPWGVVPNAAWMYGTGDLQFIDTNPFVGYVSGVATANAGFVYFPGATLPPPGTTPLRSVLLDFLAESLTFVADVSVTITAGGPQGPGAMPVTDQLGGSGLLVPFTAANAMFGLTYFDEPFSDGLTLLFRIREQPHAGPAVVYLPNSAKAEVLSVSEPDSLGLFGIGFAGLVVLWIRRRTRPGLTQNAYQLNLIPLRATA